MTGNVGLLLYNWQKSRQSNVRVCSCDKKQSTSSPSNDTSNVKGENAGKREKVEGQLGVPGSRNDQREVRKLVHGRLAGLHDNG